MANNNIKNIKLGSPQSIELTQGCPNAELTVQSMSRCNKLELIDETNSKCTKQGGIKAAANLLNKFKEESTGNININIKGNGTLNSDEIDLFFELLNKYTSNSNINSVVNTEVCYEDAANALHERFPQFTIETVKYFVRFKDKEVLRVLLENGVGKDGAITTEQLANVTSIGTWFKGNTVIEHFDELKDSGVTTIGNNSFKGCTNLKSISVDKIVQITGSSFWDGMFDGASLDRLDFLKLTQTSGLWATNLKCNTVFMPSYTTAPAFEFNGSKIDRFIVPSVTSGGHQLWGWYTNPSFGFLDYGPNINTWGEQANRSVVGNIIIRAKTVVTLKSDAITNSVKNNIFVFEDMVSAYSSDQYWGVGSKIQPIGGTKWIELFGSSDKSANLTEFEKSICKGLFPDSY